MLMLFIIVLPPTSMGSNKGWVDGHYVFINIRKNEVFLVGLNVVMQIIIVQYHQVFHSKYFISIGSYCFSC